MKDLIILRLLFYPIWFLLTCPSIGGAAHVLEWATLSFLCCR